MEKYTVVTDIDQVFDALEADLEVRADASPEGRPRFEKVSTICNKLVWASRLDKVTMYTGRKFRIEGCNKMTNQEVVLAAHSTARRAIVKAMNALTAETAVSVGNGTTATEFINVYTQYAYALEALNQAELLAMPE